MPQMRTSTLFSSFWGRTGIMVTLTSLVVSILLPATALAAHDGYGDKGAQGYGYHDAYQACSHHHTVMIGEMLQQIAAQYGVNVQELAQANNIDDPNYIFEHQRLCIPGHYTGAGNFGGSHDKGYDTGYPGQASYDDRGHSPGNDRGGNYGMGDGRGYSGQASYDDRGYGPGNDHGGNYGMGNDMGYPSQVHYDDRDHDPTNDHGDKYMMGNDMGHPGRDRDHESGNGAFQGFAPALLVTSKGPAGATRILQLYLHESGWRYLRIGYASAIAALVVLFLAALTLLYMRLLRVRI